MSTTPILIYLSWMTTNLVFQCLKSLSTGGEWLTLLNVVLIKTHLSWELLDVLIDASLNQVE